MREVNFDPLPKDKLYLVGDLVARGPDSRGVVERVDAYKYSRARQPRREGAHVVAPRAPSDSAPPDAAVRLSDRHRTGGSEALGEDHFQRLDAAPLVLPLPETPSSRSSTWGVDPRKAPHEASDEVLLSRAPSPSTTTGSRTRSSSRVPGRAPGADRGSSSSDTTRGATSSSNPTPRGSTPAAATAASSRPFLCEGEALPVEITERRKRLVSVTARAAYCPTGTGDGPE